GQAATRAADDARLPRRHHDPGAIGDDRPAAGPTPPDRAGPPDRQRRSDLAWAPGARPRRRLEPALGRARVGGVRRGSQTSCPAPGRARPDLADAMAGRAGEPPRRGRRADRPHGWTVAVE